MKQESPVSAWDSNWQKYRRDGRIEETPDIQERILAHCSGAGRAALEIGAGTGGDSAALAETGTRVIALDFSAEAVALLQTTVAAACPTLIPVRGDAWTLPFRDATFDLVFHQGFLEHFPEPAALVQEQVRVLKPGGVLLVDVPQRYTLYGMKKFFRVHTGRWFAGYERSFSIYELHRLVRRCGLDVIDTYGRGYSPHIVHHLRHLQGLWSHRLMGSPYIRRSNDRLWHVFERSAIAKVYFKDIGIVCRKP